MTTTTSLRMLISGASVSGPSLTYFLTRSINNIGHPSTLSLYIDIVERSPCFRLGGQNVDIQGASLAIIREYPELEQEIRKWNTNNQGFKVVDGNGVWAQFDKGLVEEAKAKAKEGEKPKRTQTEQIEIPRGLLAQVFYDATKDLDNVNYRFGDHVIDLSPYPGGDGNKNQTQVTLKSGRKEIYDLVIAADGLGSKTRSIAFSLPSSSTTSFPPSANPVKPLGIYTAYFSIPHSPALDGNWARLFNAPGGRAILLEPDGRGRTRGAFIVNPGTDLGLKDELEAATKIGMKGQKALMKKIFQGTGWESSRIIRGMIENDDFYYTPIAQVKTNQWTNSDSTVTLLGDAGYSPSPVTGMGASLAITSSRILAGEILLHSTDIPLALKEYERILRPFAKKSQSIMPGQVDLFCPRSKWVILARNMFLWGVAQVVGSWLVKKLGGFFSGGGAEGKNVRVKKNRIVDGIDLARYDH